MYTKKVEIGMVKEEYSLDIAIEEYEGYTQNIGLWKSEKMMFEKYVPKTASILDIGCGAGRTTIALYEHGWKNITGVDLSECMIESAQKISGEKNLKISFEDGDATKLRFGDNSFDAALFSFNGLMCIPDHRNRLKAMKEIHRVLRNGGIFIFTTHDRDLTPDEFKHIWEEEKIKWENGTQDPRIFDFGDRITTEENGRDIFIHIALPADVRNMLKEAGFELVETAMRSEICEEPEKVKEYSFDCRFWIARKQ